MRPPAPLRPPNPARQPRPAKPTGRPSSPAPDPDERFRLLCGVFAGGGICLVFGGIAVFLVLSAISRPTHLLIADFDWMRIAIPLGCIVLSLFGLFIVGTSIEGLVGPNPLSAATNALWKFVSSFFDSPAK